jgi:molybdenum cofactor cytidylyltransferase
VSTLIAAYERERPRVLVPTYRGRRGHPMIFSGELIPELLAAPLDQGARAVVRRHQVMELPVEDEGILLDLDDPESYRQVTGQSVPSV